MFFKKLFNTISKSMRPYFLFEDHTAKFLLSNKEYFDFPMTSSSRKDRFSQFVQNGYTISTNDIFIESITLKQDSCWSGQPRGLYEQFFKEQLKIKSFELLERVDILNYEFSSYKIDNSFVIHLIYIWSSNSNTFIWDSKGELFKQLQTTLNNEYIYTFNDSEKGDISFDISLTHNHITQGCFESNH